MLIVCTQDQDIRRWALNPESGSQRWGQVVLLPEGTQRNANAEFIRALTNLADNEPLCLSAHGNDTEIGDDGGRARGWGWTCDEVGEMLRQSGRQNYQGPILCSVCCRTVANFSAGLAVALTALHICNRLWVFGYNKSVPANIHFPAPGDLAKKADLQGTQVNYLEDLLAKGA